jgi:hypothetical protein
VRLIAGNPVTMRQMTRHLPAVGSYAPVASAIAPYDDAAAYQGCPAAGQRSPQPPAPRDRHVGNHNRGTPVPENALAQSQTALNAQALQANDHEQIVPINFSQLPADW